MGSSEWLGRRVTSLDQLQDNAPREDDGDEDVAGDVGYSFLRQQDDEMQAVLREVLTPFVDRLAEKHRDILEAMFYERQTEEQVGERLGVDRSVVSRRRDTAMRALVRELALEDEAFRTFDDQLHTGQPGRPPRDYDAEKEAAWRVLSRLLAR